MKIAKNKLSQKILIVMCAMLMLFNFAAPAVKADDNGWGGTLFEPVQALTTALGDAIIWGMQYAFYGTTSSVTQKIEVGGDVEVPLWVFTVGEAAFTAGGGLIADGIYTFFNSNTVDVPQIRISPESIFSNKIPAFDINFFSPMGDIDNKETVDISTNEKFVNALSAGKISLSNQTYANKVIEIFNNLKNRFPDDLDISNVDNTLNSDFDEDVAASLQSMGSYATSHGWSNFWDETTGFTTVQIEINTRGSSAGILQSTVSYWYNLLRNISIIGLLSVLVYIGIRIVIASTAADKSKYKEMIKDWVIAICLLFFMHYFMSFTVTVISTVSTALSPSSSSYEQTATIEIDDETTEQMTYYGDKLIGNARLQLQSGNLAQKMAYTIIYLVLVMYTVIFALMYLKRVIYMAFLTMIAPLVALTYPLDKIRDGKAQAFDMWMKEYVFNALIQPFHLIIYYLVVSSALDLATDNPLYALVAIGFMLPAEKLLRRFFGFNKSETSGALGGMLGGALVMQGINALSRRVKGGAGVKGGKPEQDVKDRNKPIRTANSGNNTGKLMDEIASENPGALQGNENESNTRFAQDNTVDSRQNNSNSSEQDANERGIFERQDEMDRLGEQLDQYTNEDIYMNPELQQLQERYNELATERDMFENQDNIETSKIPGSEEPDDDSQTPQYEEISDEKRFARAIGGTALRYTGKAGLGALKLAAKGTAAATLGMVGVAAGLASDDYTNVVEWGAAGAVAGNMAAKSAMNKLPSSAYRVKAAVERERDRFEQEAYSKSKRKEVANDRADRIFLRDKQVIRQYKDEFGEREYKQAMQNALRYREYGVTDNDTIIKAMKLKTRGLGAGDDRRRILVAKTASQLNRKDVDSFGDRLIANRFSQRDAENMKQAIRDFNDWE